ncbi:MAG: hypothetical protein IJ206_05275 [Oscillospiraceae bacterium]|nr:hypothetical protein [Oscillospiraceae bacterium]
MFRKISENVSIHKLVSVLLAAAILCGLLPAMSTQAFAADRTVYYPVDFSDDMLRSGVGQKIAKDCQFVTVVTMEAYMAGAVSDKEKDTVYTAVKNANPGSTSGKPNAEVIQSPNWGKTIGYENMTYSLENLYREISRGNPVMIYRAGTSTKSPHWSVVCGYTGSASKLEESGFQMVNVSHSGVNRTNLKSWRNGRKIIGCKRRTFGVAITALPGIRFCVDHPAIVQVKGATFGAFGSVVSNNKLTDVTVSVTEVYSGSSIYSQSIDPKAKSCDIRKNFDRGITMAKWGEGEYYYTITAADSAGNNETYQVYFTIQASCPAAAPEEPCLAGPVAGAGIAAAEQTETVNEGTEPEEPGIMEAGAEVAAAAAAAAQILEEAETVTEETEPEEPGIMEAGAEVAAAAAAAAQILEEAETVTEETEPEEPGFMEAGFEAATQIMEEAEAQIEQSAPVEILLDNAILPAGAIAQGSAFTVSGVLSSDCPITDVAFAVNDESGNTVFQAEANPCGSRFSLYDLDSCLTFSKLACGTYTWTVISVNETTCSRWDGSFSVAETDVKGSGCTYPQGTLSKGKTFSCKGTVSSGSNISNVTMSVYSVDGEVQFEASAAPGASTFDLHELDDQMTFRLLDSGRYIYRVTVTDCSGVARNVITTSFAVQ